MDDLETFTWSTTTVVASAASAVHRVSRSSGNGAIRKQKKKKKKGKKKKTTSARPLREHEGQPLTQRKRKEKVGHLSERAARRLRRPAGLEFRATIQPPVASPNDHKKNKIKNRSLTRPLMTCPFISLSLFLFFFSFIFIYFLFFCRFDCEEGDK